MAAQRETPWWTGLEDILDDPPSTYLSDLESRNRRLMARALRGERDEAVTLSPEQIEAWCEDMARRDPFAGEE